LCGVSERRRSKEEGNVKKHVSNPTDEQKDKIIMTLFFKASGKNIIMANYEIDPAILLPFTKEVRWTCSMVRLTSVLLVLCLRIPNYLTIPGLALLKKLICVFMWFERGKYSQTRRCLYQ
jgi:hypothetical protein